jgi:hypothetical protein
MNQTLLGKFTNEKESSEVYLIFGFYKDSNDNLVRPIGIRADKIIKRNAVIGLAADMLKPKDFKRWYQIVHYDKLFYNVIKSAIRGNLDIWMKDELI